MKFVKSSLEKYECPYLGYSYLSGDNLIVNVDEVLYIAKNNYEINTKSDVTEIYEIRFVKSNTEVTWRYHLAIQRDLDYALLEKLLVEIDLGNLKESEENKVLKSQYHGGKL